MKHLPGILAVAVVLTALSGCLTRNEDKTSSNEAMKPEHLVADTIFYPVRIKNIDPADEWADNRLSKLDRTVLVDEIFGSIYSGKTVAYNYLTDLPIAIEEIKELEQREDFSRNNIVELEFREKWWFNPDKALFEKEVLSVLVAYAVFEDDGRLRSMKAAFYIKPKH